MRDVKTGNDVNAGTNYFIIMKQKLAKAKKQSKQREVNLERFM